MKKSKFVTRFDNSHGAGRAGGREGRAVPPHTWRAARSGAGCRREYLGVRRRQSSWCVLLARRPDNFADPGPGLLIERPGHVALPGFAVRSDLLQDHPAQPRENRSSNDRQDHGFRFLRHAHILLTAHRSGHSAAKATPGRTACQRGSAWRGWTAAGRAPFTHPARMRPDAPRPVEWACKLAERPFTLYF